LKIESGYTFFVISFFLSFFFLIRLIFNLFRRAYTFPAREYLSPMPKDAVLPDSLAVYHQMAKRFGASGFNTLRGAASEL